MKYFKFIILLSATLVLVCFQSQAKDITTSQNLITISDAWVRATNPGQEVGAAYMTLLSREDLTLVSVESSVTNSVEIHNMTMENGVMKMRMLENLTLKTGEPFKLAPGGFHLMLFDLKIPLSVGEQVQFTLHFKSNTKTKKSVEYQQTINVVVKTPTESANH